VLLSTRALQLQCLTVLLPVLLPVLLLLLLLLLLCQHLASQGCTLVLHSS
jgi:hypothetical protein